MPRPRRRTSARPPAARFAPWTAGPHLTNSAEAVESLNRLRTQRLPQTLGEVRGVEYAASGEVARSVDYAKHQAEQTPWVIAFVLLLTFLMIGLISVLLNLLSAAAFGALSLGSDVELILTAKSADYSPRP